MALQRSVTAPKSTQTQINIWVLFLINLYKIVDITFNSVILSTT